MKISVILCTYNRCQSLAKTLESPWARTWHFVRKYSESMVVSERTDEELFSGVLVQLRTCCGTRACQSI